MRIRDAEHAETSPHAAELVITALACSLVGQSETIRIQPGSLAHAAYGAEAAHENYHCNFGLNPAFRTRIVGGPMVATGVGADGEIRIIELRGHPFFVATLFLPQLSSSLGAPHPLIVAYLKAALDARSRQGAGRARPVRR